MYRIEAYLGFFFAFIGFSPGVVAGSVVGDAWSTVVESVVDGAVVVDGALGSTVLMSVVVGESGVVLGSGEVGLVVVPGVTGAVCGAVWAKAPVERPMAATPKIRLRIVFSFPIDSGRK